jgi:hypothetical protein
MKMLEVHAVVNDVQLRDGFREIPQHIVSHQV